MAWTCQAIWPNITNSLKPSWYTPRTGYIAFCLSLFTTDRRWNSWRYFQPAPKGGTCHLSARHPIRTSLSQRRQEKLWQPTDVLLRLCEGFYCLKKCSEFARLMSMSLMLNVITFGNIMTKKTPDWEQVLPFVYNVFCFKLCWWVEQPLPFMHRFSRDVCWSRFTTGKVTFPFLKKNRMGKNVSDEVTNPVQHQKL